MEQIANETTEEFILRVGRHLFKGTDRRPMTQFNLLKIGYEVYLINDKKGMAVGATLDGSTYHEGKLRTCFDKLSRAMDILEEES